MSIKEIAGQAHVEVTLGGVRQALDIGNVTFKNESKVFADVCWKFSNVGSVATTFIYNFPWKSHAGYDNNIAQTIRHGCFSRAGLYDGQSNSTMTTKDYSKFKTTGSKNILQAAQSLAIGAIIAHGDNVYGSGSWKAAALSLADIPKSITSIGPSYAHPLYSGSATTTAGNQYIVFSGSPLGLGIPFASLNGIRTNCVEHIRLLGTADAGHYFVHAYDNANGRLYLRHLDGRPFACQATGTVTVWAGPRQHYFNETSIIPNSLGTPVFTGKYSGAPRDHFQIQIYYEKSGSPTPADSNQKGSYFFTARPWTWGVDEAPVYVGNQYGDMWTGCMFLDGIWGSTATTNFSAAATVAVSANGYSLDETNQKLWFCTRGNGTFSGIYYWYYKSAETVHEVAVFSGSPGSPGELTPAVTCGSSNYDLQQGSDRTIYVASKTKLIIIKSDMTTLEYNNGTGLPAADNLFAVPVDKSRARTAGSTITNAAANTIDCAGGAFTNSDIGRVIKLTGLGADNGNYKIASAPSGTQVTVTTTGGGAVSFTGATGGTFQIGDRIYLFFGDNTTGAGVINYMESLLPGTFFTRSVSMTQGAQITSPQNAASAANVKIDQTNGFMYWISTVGGLQINKYDPTTNTHTALTSTSVQTPAGGSPSNPGTFTIFYCLNYNPVHKEVWVGTDFGFLRIDVSAGDFLAANAKRWVGNSDTGTYENPVGVKRGDGSNTNQSVTGCRLITQIAIGPDGRVFGFGTSASQYCMTIFSRESENFFFWSSSTYGQFTSNSTPFHVPQLWFDSVGRFWWISPAAQLQGLVGYWGVGGTYDVHYQWINSAWTKKEIARGLLPNRSLGDNASPGLRAKDLHTAAEDLFFGLKVGFTPQGGATPANNEFLGRMGLLLPANRADGATTSGSANFTGSSFISGDVGRYLRIEGGADAGLYIISAFNSATSVALKLVTGAAFSASATAGTLTYNIWDNGTAGSNAGPETVTIGVADGYMKDSTQDINNIAYEYYYMRTLLSEQVETIKFCCPIFGPPNSPGVQAYVTQLNTNTNQSSLAGFQALGSASPTFMDCFDGLIDTLLRGTNGNAAATQVQTGGAYANNGWSAVNNTSKITQPANWYAFDFGVPVEIGSIIARGNGENPSSNSVPQGMLFTNGNGGLIANLYNASGTAPVDSVTLRTGASGTSNISIPLLSRTLTLSSGDFLGAISLASQANGSTITGQNVFTGLGFLDAHVGMVLKITAGANAGDIGSYRILSVAVGGASCVVRNLDQSAKAWVGTASPITYEVRDGVTEEDIIAIPNNTSPTNRLVIDRLLTTTTAEVRQGVGTAVTAQSWVAVKPSWNHVKRCSYSVSAVAPDYANNGSWLSTDGKDRYNDGDWKLFMDLTVNDPGGFPMTAAKRTGRYWRLSFQPRGQNSTVFDKWYLDSLEFYDTSGNRINFIGYNALDTVFSQTEFLSASTNRVDFIQSSNAAVGGSFNGLVNLGGTNGDTVTLVSGGNKFLGFQAKPGQTNGSATGGTNVFTGSGFVDSDIGRFIRVTGGANAGIYRVISNPSGTTIGLSTPAGNAVILSADAGPTSYTMHEGINVGASNPDFINFGAVDSGEEYSILSINDNLDTLVLNLPQYKTLTNQNFEIRRRASQTATVTPQAGLSARIVLSSGSTGTYPQQVGDVACDSRGFLKFYPNDVGTGNQRTDGSKTAAGNAFLGSGFCLDDVGRILQITSTTSGNDLGAYRIASFVSSSQVTLVKAHTGSAVSWVTTEGTVTYKVWGDRRFRASRYTTCLRQ